MGPSKVVKNLLITYNLRKTPISGDIVINLKLSIANVQLFVIPILLQRPSVLCLSDYPIENSIEQRAFEIIFIDYLRLLSSISTTSDREAL